MCRFSHIEKITVHIMLENETGRVEPVIENLAAHYVAPNTPAVLVALMTKPVVTEHLGIKIVRLERRVVDVHLGAFEEEETVVVYEFVPAVESEEDGLVDTFVVVDKLCKSVSLLSMVERALK